MTDRELRLAMYERHKHDEAKANARELAEMFRLRELIGIFTTFLRLVRKLAGYGVVLYVLLTISTRGLVLLFGIVGYGIYIAHREIDKRNATLDDGNH